MREEKMEKANEADCRKPKHVARHISGVHYVYDQQMSPVCCKGQCIYYRQLQFGGSSKLNERKYSEFFIYFFLNQVGGFILT